MEKLEDIIEIDKVKFEKTLFDVLSHYKTEISEYTKMYNQTLKLYEDIQYYLQNDYYIKYYKTDDNQITYKAIKKQIGFKPKKGDE